MPWSGGFTTGCRGRGCTTCKGRPRPASRSAIGTARSPATLAGWCRSVVLSQTPSCTCSTGGGASPPAVPGELHLGGVQLAREDISTDRLSLPPAVRHDTHNLDACIAPVMSHAGCPRASWTFSVAPTRPVNYGASELSWERSRNNCWPCPKSLFGGTGRCAERVPGDPWLVAWLRPRRGEKILSNEVSRSLASRLPPAFRRCSCRSPSFHGSRAEKSIATGCPIRLAIFRPIGRIDSLPRLPRETHLARLWQQLLGVASVGRNDRFVDLGGHSLLAVQLVTSLEQHYGVRLPLRAIMMESLAISQQLPGSDRAETASVAPGQRRERCGGRPSLAIGRGTCSARSQCPRSRRGRLES